MKGKTRLFCKDLFTKKTCPSFYNKKIIIEIEN